jgi:hypothetical protein
LAGVVHAAGLWRLLLFLAVVLVVLDASAAAPASSTIRLFAFKRSGLSLAPNRVSGRGRLQPRRAWVVVVVVVLNPFAA